MNLHGTALSSPIVLALGLAVLPAQAAASTWKLDPAHTEVGFSVRHMMVSNVRGKFHKFDGVIEMDDKDIQKSKLEISVETASIDTAVADRDTHLRSEDFFSSDKFPKMSFKATKIQKAGKSGLKISGDLTIRDVTKPITLAVEGPSKEMKDPWGNIRVGLSATATINRKDWGLVWNKALEAGGLLVGDDVKIEINAELVKQAEKTS